MRIWGVATSCAWVIGLALPGAALAGWGAAEPVDKNNVRQVLMAPGGQGLAVGFPAEPPKRLRFALRPLAGPLGGPLEFPSGVGQHNYPVWGFDAAGDAVILDEEAKKVYWRSADGETSAPPVLEGHLLGRLPRLVSVAPGGAALIGFNEARTPVQLAFRSAGLGGTVDTENTVDLTAKGTLVGLQLQSDGGAVAVYWDEKTEPAALMQVIRLAGKTEFETPTEIQAPGDPAKHELSFASDPSGWAMLSWSGSSTKEGPVNRALATVRAPGGTFPEASVLATGTSVSNVTPAVTSAGDGLAAWSDAGYGACIYKEGVINGATEHLGTWSGAKALGPNAWPDISVVAYGATAFGSGTDVSVPMVHIHREGTPCPTGVAQTRSLIVHHYRSGAAGLIDEGTSELTPLASGYPSVDGWAMEPAGRILAWYGVGEERFLRVFDGVLPVAGAPPSTEPLGAPAPGGTPTPAPGGTPTLAPTVYPPIEPLVLQQFAIVPTLTRAQLEFEMQCPPPTTEQNGDQGESCAGRAYGMYMFTGKQIKAYGARSAAVKRRLDVIATGSISIKAGHRGRVKLRPNRLGKALLKSGAKLKITLRLSVTEGRRSFSGSLPATIKAGRHH
jgi:hypothetical protein